MRMEIFSASQNMQKQLTNMLDTVRQELNEQLAKLGSTSATSKLHSRHFDDVEGAIAEVQQTLDSQGRKLHHIDRQLQKTMNELYEPVLESLPQLVAGVMKMLQMLGFASEDSFGKNVAWRESGGPAENWRDVCADLPRMLDHAWLRLRLKKGTTVLKLIRQKADVELIRELQSKLDSFMIASPHLSLLETAQPMAPQAEEPDAATKPLRRPMSAGRRLAPSEVRFEGQHWPMSQ
jgi:hypothetical protein